MIVVGLDLETTGFSYPKGDRIVEVCLGIYSFDGSDLTHLKTITQRINPQRAIPIEAQRVHGICLEDLREMPVWADFAEKVKKVLDRADLVVIHNAEFDAPFITGEQQGAGYPLAKPMPSFCTMNNGLWATFDGKRPSLGELAWSLGVEYDKSVAHAADYDVGVMMECFKKGLQLGFFKLPKGE